MKKILLILFLVPFVFNAQEKYERKFYKISDDFEIKVIGFGSSRAVDIGTTGMAETIYGKAKKGNEIIYMWLKIKNTTNKKIIFDLRQFQIIDQKSNIYNAYLCAGNNLNMKNCGEYEFKIKPNKRGRQARIYFEPEIPKKTKLKYLRVNGINIIDLDI